MAYLLILILGFLFVIALLDIRRARKVIRYYQSEANKWEYEYWLLRGSPAVDKHQYDIHLSWLSRGDEYFITKKHTEHGD